MTDRRSMPLFRINVEVDALDRAVAFYSALLEQEGRPQMGGRCYFDAGQVTLQVVQMPEPQLAAKALYFATDDIEGVHARAAALGCLSEESVHGAPAGEAVVRPWGEKSFYAYDPAGNPLCFVESGTIYGG